GSWFIAAGLMVSGRGGGVKESSADVPRHAVGIPRSQGSTTATLRARREIFKRRRIGSFRLLMADQLIALEMRIFAHYTSGRNACTVVAVCQAATEILIEIV